MSRVFNDTTNLSGLVQKYEKAIGADYGYVSGNTTRLKQFASATRSAWDIYLRLAIKASGKWQFDDSNHPDYPIIYTNLVSGQGDYTFTDDEQSNLVLDIYRVGILESATATTYAEVFPMDQQSSNYEDDLFSERSVTGAPLQYDKTANGLFFTPEPDYNATNGIKIYINREASYFTSSDTTKMPGCPGIHHDYFYLRPAMEHAEEDSLAVLASLRDRVKEYEGDELNGVVGIIENSFAKRSRDEKAIMRPKKILYI